jgi:hypothetical protein
VSGNLCDGAVAVMCTWGNLTYNQWLRGDVLIYPLPGIDDIEPVKWSYTIYYSDYTQLTYPPEAYYYGAVAGLPDMHDAVIGGVYRGMCANGFFDTKYFQDLMLGVDDLNWETDFLSPGTPIYLKYVTLTQGLGGLFV